VNEIKRLAKEIERHNELYWKKDKPEISDEAYDVLVESLRSLDASHPALERLQDAPQLGLFDQLEDLQPKARFGSAVTHRHPMLSLAKAYAFDELEHWFKSFDGGAIVMPKIDGIACSLRYAQNGQLECAATRGNGRQGEDITANILASGAVPTQIPAKNAVTEVRGEVYISSKAFNEHLASRFSNPRNTAAGALKQKDHDATGGYHLQFFAYDLITANKLNEGDKIARLGELGFDATEHRLCCDYKEAESAVKNYSDGRADLPYETDGVVLRAQRESEQQRLGLTAHHPRFAMAFKFAGDVAETDLIAIEWQVARTGTITPVAKLEPVDLSGAMVSRASLHHAGRVESLALQLPARVLAARRGGVIPHIEAVIRQGDSAVVIPKTCPGCGADAKRNDDFLLCSKPQTCRPASIARLLHWAKAFDIEGLGKKLAEQLYDEDLVKQPLDLYTLSGEELITLPRMAQKSVENLLDQIKMSRTKTAQQLLIGLGIDDLGVTVSERLLADLGSLTALRQASEERLLQIDGVGDITAPAIFEALAVRRDEIDALLKKLDLQNAPNNTLDDGGPLKGYWIVFTGTLASSDRKTAQIQARKLGASTPSNVLSQDQGLLIVGDRNSALHDEGRVSSKHAKARTQIRKGLDLLILSESEWTELFKQQISLQSLHNLWANNPR
jgi:DNA ligase (NAD+)